MKNEPNPDAHEVYLHHDSYFCQLASDERGLSTLLIRVFVINEPFHFLLYTLLTRPAGETALMCRGRRFVAPFPRSDRDAICPISSHLPDFFFALSSFRLFDFTKSNSILLYNTK